MELQEWLVRTKDSWIIPVGVVCRSSLRLSTHIPTARFFQTDWYEERDGGLPEKDHYMSDYYDKFSHLYDQFAAREDDIEFFVDHLKVMGGETLELACGSGRLLLPIAKSGIKITGLDISHEMLEIAKEKISKLPKTIQNRISIINMDVRDFDLKKKFKNIIYPYNSFQHILTPEDQIKALICINKHLDEDNGVFVLEVFDPNFEQIANTEKAIKAGLKYSDLTEKTELKHHREGYKYLTHKYMSYEQCSIEDQKLCHVRIIEEINEKSEVVNKEEAEWLTRYSFRYEMTYLLQICGFEVIGVYKNHQKEPYTYGTGLIIWILRKAPTSH